MQKKQHLLAKQAVLWGGNSGSATISASYATGNATATGNNGAAGGLVGDNKGTIRACYATGDATGTANNGTAGGLVGHNNQGSIIASYATGNVTGNSTAIGGLVGFKHRYDNY